MIKLSNIHKVYKSKSGQEVVALGNISFDLPEKGLVFIIGKSGSGKSTMLNILGGLDSATAGDIELGGVGKLSDKDILDAYRNTYLGFVFQEFHLLETLTVYENIALALEMKGDVVSKIDIVKALDRIDLGGLTNRYPEELSGGQKQRVAIARALIKNPHIILADEPTGNLDSTTSGDILSLLKDLSADRLVVIVSHDKEAAARHGDRTIELKDGKVVADTAAKQETVGQTVKPSNTALRNAKFSLKSALKFVGSALTHKKAKLIASIVLSVLAIMMFGAAFTISNYDTEKQIAKNINKFGVNSIIISPVPNADVSNLGLKETDIFDYNKAVPSNIYDYLSNNYASMGKLPIYEASWFAVPFSNGIIDNIRFTAVIESENDIAKATGLKLLPTSLPISDGSVYLTDAVIYTLSGLTAPTEDGFGTMSAYYLKKDNAVTNLTRDTAPSSVIGTELWVRSSKAEEERKIIEIAGVVETDYENLLADYEKLSSQEKAVGDYNGKLLYSLVFCNKETFLKQFKPSAEFSIDFIYLLHGNDWKLPCYDFQFFINGSSIAYNNGLTVRKAENSPLEQNLQSLNAGEIIITVDFYNLLFGEAVKWVESGFSPAPTHIGEKITLQAKDKSGRVVATLHELTLKAITYNDPIGGNIIYGSQIEFDTLYPLSKNAKAVVLGLNGYSDTEAFLKELRANDYYVFAPFSMGIYDFEMKFHAFYPIFGGSAGILLLFSVLLIMNFIGSGVNAKKKEIGILRALGASVSDTEKIFILEAIIIATIVAMLSIAMLVGTAFAINASLATGEMAGAAVISFNWLAIPIIIGLSYIITALSAALPAYKISKMKPADAIKKVS